MRYVFNTGAEPVEIDEAGHILWIGDWRHVEDNPLLDQAVADGRVTEAVEVSTESADTMSTEDASSAVPPEDPAQ